MKKSYKLVSKSRKKIQKKKGYVGPERRQFERLDYVAPLNYKVCKRSTISKLLFGYTSDISARGLLCNLKAKVKKGDILWLAFDRGTLSICEEIDKKILIYQNGVIGKVVRIENKSDKSFNVGVLFLTREEKNLTNIYPQIYFLKEGQRILPQQEGEPDSGEDISSEEEKGKPVGPQEASNDNDEELEIDEKEPPDKELDDRELDEES